MPDDPPDDDPPRTKPLSTEERRKLFDWPLPAESPSAPAPAPTASTSGSFLELTDTRSPAVLGAQSGKVVDRIRVGGFGIRAGRLLAIGLTLAVFFAWGMKILYRY